MASPTADWDRVGDRYYRKVKLYDAIFDQDLELENYIIAGAPYGGALALCRDEQKLHSYRGTQSAKLSIDIYSYAGKLLKRINWDQGPIRGLGWSEDEKLLVVTEDGTVRCYYDFQSDFTQFSLGHGAEEHGVASCRFWAGGFVALLTNNRLVAVTQYVDPRPKLLAVPPSEKIQSWSLIPPGQTLSRSVEVLLAIGQTIYVVDATEAEDRLLQNGPFHHISVSPNGKFVAVYTEDGRVWVISSDFQERLSEYNSRVKTVPKDVQWCGNNSVVLAWEDEIHMVGPKGVALKYYYDGWVHILADIDGVRLITNDVCEFLQKVPDDTEDVFRLGSQAPASVLLDAVDQLEKKSARADDRIKLIQSNLDEAIDSCIRAAGEEFSSQWQKQLLKAASFGKLVLPLYDSDGFVKMCETLRVLNAVRDYRIGLPISYEQYQRLTPTKLIHRLINRGEYLLSIRLSEYLHLPTERIYVHWASQKVRSSSEPDDVICATVVERLKDRRGISFESIAKTAYDDGRPSLATQLLNHEPRAGRQVPLLLSMEEDSIALDKAIESGDTDLVFFVLLQLKSKLPLASFFRLLSSRPLASALVESSAAAEDTALLKDLYYQDDRILPSSNLLFSEALAQSHLQSKVDKLRLSVKAVSDSKDPSAVFQQKALREAQQLLRTQDTLDKDLGGGYTGLSLNATLYHLIENNYLKRAYNVQSDFKVAEKIYAWIRLRALVASRNFGEIEELSKSRKSPIGWEPYFNEVLGAGNSKLASVYVSKCAQLTPQERSEMYVKCGSPMKAAEELVKIKDVAGMEELKAKTGDRIAAQEIERMIAPLRSRR
ncbi:hypothetical protein MMC25_003779 [Agyrium rufum]|nr:hypothetical protein [Agyrium rufum]